MSVRGADEYMGIVRRTAGDDDTFEAALRERARREIVDTLDALLRAAESGTPGSIRVASYAELASLGRRLAAAAALIAEHEAKGGHPLPRAARRRSKSFSCSRSVRFSKPPASSSTSSTSRARR